MYYLIGNALKEGDALNNIGWESKNGHTMLDHWLVVLAVAGFDAWRERVNPG